MLWYDDLYCISLLTLPARGGSRITGKGVHMYRSIKKVISLRNISKVFFTFLLDINGVYFTKFFILFSCHFIFINHIKKFNQTTL